MRHRRPIHALAVALAAVTLLSACADEELAETESSAANLDDTGNSVAEPADADEDDDEEPDDEATTSTTTATEPSATECRPGPDRTVTPIEPVVIPDVEIPAVEVPDEVIDGQVVRGFVIPAETVPGERVDTGCIIEFAAPGGCLGAVEITGFEIPSATIPGVVIPAAELGGERTEEVRIDAVEIEGVSVDPVRVEEVCQQEPPEGGGVVSSVVRSSLVRASAVRSSGVRSSGVRSSHCFDAGCIDSVPVDSVPVDSVPVDSVPVDSETIDSFEVDGTEAEVIEEDDRTTYLAPADVLFEFDQGELGPDAVPTLEAIVAALAGAAADAAITVEGHTDGVGGEQYNQDLSDRRAAAVAAWLSGPGGIAAERITTVGYGAGVPVAANTNPDGSDNPEGRARNRRVVITVATA